ncbi:helix-turn-helix domain-containing protein [Cohnella sp. GCM10027633]|uniref:helix-turn-helix domain-containing protein n=1 Tax=unclassified Cohnella TaxID=2636738 RepID=UPI0036366315
MYGYSGSAREDDVYLGHRISSTPYAINCCGYAKLDDYDVSIDRTRIDLYLIYLINGIGRYMTDDGDITARAGSIILYKPDEHQNYFYRAFDKAELYWIHFTGDRAEALLDELRLSGNRVFQVGIHSEYMEIFENIIHELQVQKPYFQQKCNSYLLQLLSSFSRNAEALRSGNKVHEGYLDNIIKVMNEEFQKGHDMDYYAKLSGLSIFQFIRTLKKQTNYSPAKYIEKIRIAKAKELLRDSSLTIAEISAIVGYTDPFYFSKVFKKASGITPSEFRSASQ